MKLNEFEAEHSVPFSKKMEIGEIDKLVISKKLIDFVILYLFNPYSSLYYLKKIISSP